MPSLPIEPFHDKASLRKHLSALRNGLSEDVRRESSDRICAALLSLPQYHSSGTVLLYAPIRSEVDLMPLARIALSEGKSVAFPISHVDSTTLTFHRITSAEDLVTGAYGIREPSASLPLVTDFSDSLCLVPALALDRFGYRLGYGKGFYDRHLAHFDGVSVGVCFGDCLIDRLPHDAHDRRVDLILTEGGVVFPHE